ncbi:hypothetical protein ANACOL_03413 [Anaerotruncus colihominis DSM 17241]|uniref:Uncharacterized protein n=1 Tax=Anaerotruncus colihominis DSM 17241 TaxID=445972 RepID=B0PF34_9FIRM|nr:hypothetical protein ANACOL_03413 [Anaerotruncus colihominis DSM 17241]
MTHEPFLYPFLLHIKIFDWISKTTLFFHKADSYDLLNLTNILFLEYICLDLEYFYRYNMIIDVK